MIGEEEQSEEIVVNTKHNKGIAIEIFDDKKKGGKKPWYLLS